MLPGGPEAGAGSIDFEPGAGFAGVRPGFVFQAGPLGLGYYRDGSAAQRGGGGGSAEALMAGGDTTAAAGAAGTAEVRGVGWPNLLSTTPADTRFAILDLWRCCLETCVWCSHPRLRKARVMGNTGAEAGVLSGSQEACV